MVILSKFSESLSELMQEAGLTVKELAQKTSIGATNIYYYLRAQRLPSVEAAVALADCFGCSVGYLLGLEEERQTKIYKQCPPFSERLDFLIGYFKVTTYKVYTQTNVSKARFFDWKRGKHAPTLDNIIRLSEIFNCSVDFVLGRV